VNTEDLPAFWAAPSFFFVSDEMLYAEFSYVLEIVDHAHAILGPIPLIQTVQPVIGEAVTTKAVLDYAVHDLLPVFDFTCDAGFRFEAVVTPATGAWFPLSCECAA